MNDPLSQELTSQIYAALIDGQKIQAIKLYREATGAGLAESKAHVEAMEETFRAQNPGTFPAKTVSKGCSVYLFLLASVTTLLWKLATA